MRVNVLRRALLACLCVQVFSLTSFADDGGAVPTDDMVQSSIQAYNRFGLKLFQEIAQSDSGLNVFISPASAAFALAMLYNGAAGTTREELAYVLGGLGELTLQQENEANAELLGALRKADSGVQLAVANSIWYRNSFEFRQDFLDLTRRYYSAQVAALDFDDPSAPAIVNEWVKENTRGKINKVIEKINPDDVMFLMNAVYFKGTWTHTFPKELTSGRAFHRLDGTTIDVPMMQQTREFAYLATESFQAIRLSYGKGSCSMILLLPAEEYGLARLVAELTPAHWDAWLAQLYPQDVHIVMPKFKLEYTRLLNDPLKALGMASAFNPDLADLSGLWNPPEVRPLNLFVSYVRQKTFVEVNEEGTEAAAVTDIGITVTSVPPPPVDMVVDRPFFCAIVDDHTGLLLFMGAIADPAGVATD